jgi:hypothetical protein
MSGASLPWRAVRILVVQSEWLENEAVDSVVEGLTLGSGLQFATIWMGAEASGRMVLISKRWTTRQYCIEMVAS